MTYEDHFSKDWESLTRDEAMVRAFVLGVESVDGNPDGEELARLRREANRAFVELAYNAGRRERLDLEDDADATDSGPAVEDLPTATRERLSELAAARPDGPSASDSSDGADSQSQVDLPALLEAYDFLDAAPDADPDDQNRLDLPEFLK